MNASSGANPRAPTATETTAAAAPHHAGTNSRLRSVSALALRHGSTGATAIRNSSSSATGMVIRSKYEAPTLSLRSDVASITNG